MDVEYRLWIEFIWFKKGTGRRALGTRQWISGFHP